MQRKTFTLVLLTLPLLWLAYIWLEFVIQVGISLDFMPESLWFLLLVLGTPLSFICGVIYTYKHRKWWWFGIYMILGGVPVLGYIGGVLFSKLSR
ncbi:TPA: hypothetical protein ACN30P_003213 [Vibrio parahaemolyticus]|nr:hypothetical protein [Vibrio parahaemolyticus]